MVVNGGFDFIRHRQLFAITIKQAFNQSNTAGLSSLFCKDSRIVHGASGFIARPGPTHALESGITPESGCLQTRQQFAEAASCRRGRSRPVQCSIVEPGSCPSAVPQVCGAKIKMPEIAVFFEKESRAVTCFARTVHRGQSSPAILIRPGKNWYKSPLRPPYPLDGIKNFTDRMDRIHWFNSHWPPIWPGQFFRSDCAASIPSS